MLIRFPQTRTLRTQVDPLCDHANDARRQMVQTGALGTRRRVPLF
jgi:hypothetical protein